MSGDRTADQQWVRDRIKAVSERYDVHDALIEFNIEVDDRDVTLQIQCPLPGHGPDNRPSARYYATDGSSSAHFYCYKCKMRLDGVGLFAKMKGLDFMRALSELERRFSIKTLKRPEASLQAPIDKSGTYESKAWEDVPRMINMLEAKLLRLRPTAPLVDYVKWCRFLDAVMWDIDKNGGQPMAHMAASLVKLKEAMDKSRQNADI